MTLVRGTTGRGLTTDGTEELAYDSATALGADYKCKRMRVQCIHATVGCFVRIPSLHGEGAGVYILPRDEGIISGDGTVVIFEGVDKVYIAGDGAQTEVSWGAV